VARSNKAQTADAPAGVPAWVMTFADLMTLLMCFFVLLLSFSEMDAAKYKQVAGSMKFAFGVQREVKVMESPKGVSIIAQEFTPGKPRPTLEKVLRQQTTDENRQYLEMLDPRDVAKLDKLGGIDAVLRDAMGGGAGDGGKAAGTGTATAQGAGEGAGEGSAGAGEGSAEAAAATQDAARERMLSARQAARIQAALLSIALEEEIDEGLLEIETQDEGVLVRVREQGSFPSGSADLAHSFLPVLDKLAAALISEDSRLVVSGHSDDRPIATGRYPSNWLLSAARATSVVQALANSALVDVRRMEVRAHAETLPVASNRDASGRARNRRVEIFIGTPPALPPPPPTSRGDAAEDAT
jgi:chemotaxis protein MotB